MCRKESTEIDGLVWTEVNKEFGRATYPIIRIFVSNTETTMSLSNWTLSITNLTACSNSSKSFSKTNVSKLSTSVIEKLEVWSKKIVKEVFLIEVEQSFPTSCGRLWESPSNILWSLRFHYPYGDGSKGNSLSLSFISLSFPPFPFFNFYFIITLSISLFCSLSSSFPFSFYIFSPSLSQFLFLLLKIVRSPQGQRKPQNPLKAHGKIYTHQ